MRFMPALMVMLLSGCTAPSSGGGDGSGAGTAITTSDGVPLGPDWSFADTDGTTHSRDSARGKPTLLFFMATWCTKCQATAPRLAEAHEALDERAHFFTISWDPTEDTKDLQDWKARYAQSWPHGLGGAMRDTFQVTRQSTLVVLDANGIETTRFSYATPSKAQIEEALVAAGA